MGSKASTTQLHTVTRIIHHTNKSIRKRLREKGRSLVLVLLLANKIIKVNNPFIILKTRKSHDWFCKDLKIKSLK